MFRIVTEVQFINHNFNLFAEVVTFVPRFIALIQAAQVIKANAVFIFSATFLNLIYKCRNGTTKIDKQIGWLNDAGDRFKKRTVGLKNLPINASQSNLASCI